MIPQIIYLVLYGVGLLILANQHGKPKTGNHNFWITATAGLISPALLYWGGFFDVLFN